MHRMDGWHAPRVPVVLSRLDLGAEQLHRSRQPDHDEFPWGSHGWIQGFNAHARVEEDSGVIVAQEVSAQSTDSPRLGHVLARPDENLAGLGIPEG